MLYILQFYNLANPDQLRAIACDPVQFDQMFTFPNGSNVSLIQTSLCDVLTNKSTALQELVDLFDARDMLVQVLFLT